MRWTFVLQVLTCALGVFGSGCGDGDKQALVLEEGVPARINGCTLVVHKVFADLLDVESSCTAPESELREEQWWGDGGRPGMYGLKEGSCTPLRDRYYCVTSMSPPSFEATYELPGKGGVLHRLEK